MNTRSKKKLLAIWTLALSLTAGCGGVSQLSRLEVVTALGVEQGEGGILLTSEIGRQSDEGYRAEGTLSQSQGTTLEQAMADSARGRELSLSHVEVLLLDEATARQGLTGFADFWQSQPELGMGVSLAVVSDSTCQQVLDKENFKGQVPGLALRHMLERQQKQGYGSWAQMQDVKRYSSVALPLITVQEGQVTVLGQVFFERGQWLREERER